MQGVLICALLRWRLIGGGGDSEQESLVADIRRQTQAHSG